MAEFVSYYAGFCAIANEVDSDNDQLYCDCPNGAGEDVCSGGLLISSCAVTPVASSGLDVTADYIDVAEEPQGCVDPTVLHPDLIFDPDLDFVPDTVSIDSITIYIF